MERWRGGGLPTLNSCQTRQVACDERVHFATLPPFSSRAASADTGAAGAVTVLQLRGKEKGKGRLTRVLFLGLSRFSFLGLWGGEGVCAASTLPKLAQKESVRCRAVRMSISFPPQQVLL